MRMRHCWSWSRRPEGGRGRACEGAGAHRGRAAAGRTAEAQLPYKEQLYELGGLSALELQEAKDDIERRRQEVANARQALLLVERQAELAVRQAEQKAHNVQRALEDS